MSETAPIGCDRVDRVLAGLHAGAVLAVSGDARLVAGGAGAFVLLPAAAEPTRAGERAARLAEATRDALADHLSWVPFVDAVVVVRPGERAGGSVTAVPVDLLAVVLVEGPRQIADPTLARIAALVAQGRLGAWRAATVADDGRIEPCPPVDATPAVPLPAGATSVVASPRSSARSA
jgi:hypothetical protein